jgi:predicted HD phosphohydrolase
VKHRGVVAALGAAAAVGALAAPGRLRRWAHRGLSPGWRDFAREARAISERHARQTRETVAALRSKYERPIFGRVRVWDLVERLALCVDPTDGELYCVSQLVHVQQVLAGMERDRMGDADLILAAVVHDLGKVLLLTGEAPEHVVGMNAPIGPHAQGIGLDQAVLQWNHDELAYSRLRDHVPEPVAWLVRYHSLMVEAARPLMDARDRDYLARYLVPFRRYDQGTKSVCSLPPRDLLDRCRDVVERTFPSPILF